MVRMSSLMGLAVAVTVAGTVAAKAAAACPESGVLTEARGTVLVDRGQGFAAASIGTQVRVGDRVSVRGEGGAMVDFGGARSVSVPASTTLRLPACGVLMETGMGAAVVGTVVVAGGVGAAIARAGENGGASRYPVSP